MIRGDDRCEQSEADLIIVYRGCWPFADGTK